MTDSSLHDNVPRWYTDSMAVKPTRGTVDVAGATINYLQWGEAGKPGLVFVPRRRRPQPLVEPHRSDVLAGVSGRGP